MIRVPRLLAVARLAPRAAALLMAAAVTTLTMVDTADADPRRRGWHDRDGYVYSYGPRGRDRVRHEHHYYGRDRRVVHHHHYDSDRRTRVVYRDYYYPAPVVVNPRPSFIFGFSTGPAYYGTPYYTTPSLVLGPFIFD